MKFLILLLLSSGIFGGHRRCEGACYVDRPVTEKQCNEEIARRGDAVQVVDGKQGAEGFGAAMALPADDSNKVFITLYCPFGKSEEALAKWRKLGLHDFGKIDDPDSWSHFAVYENRTAKQVWVMLQGPITDDTRGLVWAQVPLDKNTAHKIRGAIREHVTRRRIRFPRPQPNVAPKISVQVPDYNIAPVEVPDKRDAITDAWGVFIAWLASVIGTWQALVVGAVGLYAYLKYRNKQQDFAAQFAKLKEQLKPKPPTPRKRR